MIMKGIEQQPIIAYAIILAIIVLTLLDQDLLNLIPRQTIIIGVIVITAILYLKIRTKTSTYV